MTLYVVAAVVFFLPGAPSRAVPRHPEYLCVIPSKVEGSLHVGRDDREEGAWSRCHLRNFETMSRRYFHSKKKININLFCILLV